MKDDIIDILINTPDEGPCLDYKVVPYSTDKRYDFVKDLAGFLNSEEGKGKDKYIIFGIVDKVKFKKGLLIPMPDDNEFQGLADKIDPRPTIVVGTINYDNLDFGYVYIPATNNKQLYYIKEDYPSNEPMVRKSQVYIRRGTTNCVMDRYDIVNFYEEKASVVNIPNRLLISNSNVGNDDEVISKAAIIGAWDDSNPNDRDLIGRFVGQPYDDWIRTLKNIIQIENTPIKFDNNIWSVNDRLGIIGKLEKRYFDDDIEKFQSLAIEVLSERNPKFDLKPSDRIAANIYNKRLKFSRVLRTSISETIPMIKSISSSFSNCKNKIEFMPSHVIRELLTSSGWEIWASVDTLLPSLVEAAPDDFLNILESKLRTDLATIEKLMTENEEVITTNYYYNGLYWSLELLSWNERYIVRVGAILATLSNIEKNNKSLDTISRILLPWYPQTLASIEKRKTTIEAVLNINEDFGWSLLLAILPNKQTTSCSTYKPKWINTVAEDTNENVTNKDYSQQVQNYIDMLIKYCGTDTKRLTDLISKLDDASKENFDKIVETLSQKEIVRLSDDKKYILWDKLLDLISRHKNYAHTNWALPKGAINILEGVVDKIKPKSIGTVYRRLFRKDKWNLIDDRKDRKKSEEKLNNLQDQYIKEMFSMGKEDFLSFIKSVEDSHQAGVSLAEVINDKDVDEFVFNYLDSKDEKLLAFSKGYVWKKFKSFGYEWVDGIDFKQWSMTKKCQFLTMLSFSEETWDRVSKLLGKQEKEYWESVSINIYSTEADINYAVKKMIDNNRPSAALLCIYGQVSENKDYDIELAIKALTQNIKINEKATSISYYEIVEIIKDLQSKNIPDEKMIPIEWMYLPILDGDYEATPRTIEKNLSENPEAYNEVLCLVYKKHGDEEIQDLNETDQKIAANAYRLLHNWKTPPGLSDGKIDKEKLNKWISKTKDLTRESDRFEVALIQLGHVLFYSPADPAGLWIDKNVAKILNDDPDSENIRRGYRTEAFNSRGVHFVDNTGKSEFELAEKYRKKAEEVEREGFFRFAAILQSLADEYDYYGNRYKVDQDDD